MFKHDTCKNSSVCFDCMEVNRSLFNGNCSKCGKPMISLNSKMRVPKKRRKDWDEFKEWVRNYNAYFKMLIKE